MSKIHVYPCTKNLPYPKFNCLSIAAGSRSITILTKHLHFENGLRNTMMSGAGGGKNMPKLPANNNPSTPIMPGSSTDSLPKTKEEFDKVKPFFHSFPPKSEPDTKIPSAPSIPVAPLSVKADENAAKKALKTAEDHQKIGESFNQTPELEKIQNLNDTVSVSTSQSFKSGLLTGVEAASSIPPLIIEKDTPEKYIEAIKMLPDARTPSGKDLSSHEKNGKHTLICEKDERTGTISANHIFTHAKKNHVTKKENPLVDTIDVKGNPNPQRIATLETGRLLFEEDRGKTFENDPLTTLYANDINRKVIITEAMKDKPKLHTVRPHKDAAELYTPDGRAIAEENNDYTDE